MKFTQISSTAFQEMQMNAGILCTDFDTSTGAVDEDDIVGATSGGINITIVPTFVDMGEDVDNCPKNTKELKKIQDWEIKASGTFVTASTTTAKSLTGAADVSGNKVTPRMDLADGDFSDLWFVGDYSDKNGATNGGFMAVKILNALSTGGFSIQTADREKGQFAFEYTGHTSISAQDVVPAEIYVKAGTAEPT